MKAFLVCCAAVLLLAACGGLPAARTADDLLTLPAPSYPPARFAVVSDTHLYDPSLGTEEEELQRAMTSSGKLFSVTPELIDAAFGRVEESGASFLLVCGDLTKDGERASHLLMAERLGELRRAGVRAYVVPGNHDVLNPRAVGYGKAGPAAVPSVTPEDFASIYDRFGYGEALFRDPDSLGYVAQLAPGLWLLAIDSTSCSDNIRRGHSESGPGLTPSRVSWVRSMLAEALRRGTAVICMMHHGAMEHYAGNEKYYPRYVVNGGKDFSEMLAAYNARVVFTGHFHAQDITLKKGTDGRFLYDVETGSLCAFPNPVRDVEISADQRMTVRSSFITSLPSFSEWGLDFASYARERLDGSGRQAAVSMMRRWGAPARDARVLAPQVAAAFVAHAHGDERFTGAAMMGAPGLGVMGRLAVSLRGELVRSLWSDLPPADNDVCINMGSGEWSAAE